MDAISGLGVPVWLTYSVDGERTRAGQPLEEAFSVAAGIDEVVAVGVNCCRPEDVAAAVTNRPRRSSGKPVIGYPNSGEGWDAERRRWTGSVGGSTRSSPRTWVDLGVSGVGGCCRRTRPDDVRALERCVAVG